MGIYNNIQIDMKEAMDDDLKDATATLTITETESSNTYDPINGTVSSTPIINTMRCIIVGPDDSDEQDPENPASTNDLEVMVLDSEKTVTFKLGLTANVRGSDYEISKYKVDPAGATHNLNLRRK